MVRPQKIPALVLAAGASRRCPGGKLCRPYRNKPLLDWTLDLIEQVAAVGDCWVITGGHRTAVEALVAKRKSFRSLHNPDWETGMASSLRCGLLAIQDSFPGVFVFLGDMPNLQAQTIAAVHPKTDQEQKQIRYPTLEGVPGHPKYFPREVFSEILALSGDQGARSVLVQNLEICRAIPCQDRGILRDLDRPEDFGS